MKDIIIIEDRAGHDSDIVILPNLGIVLMIEGYYNQNSDWVDGVGAYRLDADHMKILLSTLLPDNAKRRRYVKLNGVDCTQEFLNTSY